MARSFPKNHRFSWALDPWASTGLVLAAVLLLGVNLLAFRATRELRHAGRHLARGGASQRRAHELLHHFTELELCHHQYLLTGDERHFDSFRDVHARVTVLAAEWTVPESSMESVEASVTRRLRELADSMSTRRSQGREAAMAMSRAGEEPELSARIRDQVRRAAGESAQQVDDQAELVAASSTALYASVVWANLLTLGLIAAAVLALNRGFAQQRAADEELRSAHEKLEAHVRERTRALSDSNDRLHREALERQNSEARAARLAAIVESSEDAVAATDRDGRVTVWNAAAERLWGRSAAELVGQPLRDCFPPETPVASLLDTALEGQRVAAFETLVQPREGEAVPVSIRLSPIRDAQGGFAGTAAIVRDIRDRRRLETQLMQAQKLDAVGRLAAGVAHDFNNQLTVIIGFGNRLLDLLPAESAEGTAAKEILHAGERSAVLVRQLLALSRQQPAAPRILDLNAFVESSAQVLPQLLGQRIEVCFRREPDLETIWADPGQLEQVLLNLAVNARDAMPHGGRLTIETQSAELDITYTHRHAGLSPGRYVLLAVSDTGCGMTEEVRRHLFEPFFTTKEKGKGTGLGLAMVYAAVRQAGGHIAVYSEPNRGTTFKIYLPPSAGRRAAPTMPALQAPAGNESVLVVEDDESMRMLIATVLRQQGYEVVEAADGEMALLLVRERQTPLHLLVVDVGLPEIDGRELAQRLLAARPGLRTLYLSGYASHAIVEHGVLEAESQFLQKPFTPHALAEAVRAALDAASG